MVDAANAFYRINRKAALHNSATLCPAIATLLNNTYNSSADLSVGGEVLNSEEGVTQGDPLAMAMYALGTVPLINELAKHVRTKQVWYADDASDGGTLENVKAWWEYLSVRGPAYGYFPNAAKTWLLVKSDHHQRAQQLFGNTDINITTEGRRLLGAAIVCDQLHQRSRGKIFSSCCSAGQNSSITTTGGVYGVYQRHDRRVDFFEPHDG